MGVMSLDFIANLYLAYQGGRKCQFSLATASFYIYVSHSHELQFLHILATTLLVLISCL